MEINPHNATTAALRDQWHKVLALVMMQLKIKEVVITAEDLALLAMSHGGEIPAIIATDDHRGLTIRLAPLSEAVAAARKYGEKIGGDA